MKYTKILNTDTNYECIIKTNDDGSVLAIPTDPANTDYQQYLHWLEEQ